jgi:hypothetical protein
MNIDRMIGAILFKHIGRFAGVLGDDFAPLLHLLGRAIESLDQRKTLVVPVSDLDALARALQPDQIVAIAAVIDTLRSELQANREAGA